LDQDYNATATAIDRITATASGRPVRKALLLYEEIIQYIGDCCLRFDKFRYLNNFLNGAEVDINFTKPQNAKFAEGLLTNNPYLRKVTLLEWDEIDFSAYDVLYCIAYDERRLLSYLHKHYGGLQGNGGLCPAVFSLSAQILKPQADSHPVFTVNDELALFVRDQGPGELYISDAERDWAGEWLASQGLKAGEDLFVVVDSSSSREKLLKMTVYFELLAALLDERNARVLIFDENDIGKRQFYAQWLNPERMAKLIFSRSFSLRQNLCLIASRQTCLIFGPCTGLMHCSSAIYNYFSSKGPDGGRLPLMITYTGYYEDREKNAAFWWGNAPLIHCLQLKRRGGDKALAVLNDLPAAARNDNDNLPCSEYSPGMLMAFIGQRLRTLRAQAK